MMRRPGLLALYSIALFIPITPVEPLRSPLEPSNVPVPTIEGPITGGKGFPTISGTSFDLAEVGYSQEEYFISGRASAFTNVGTFRSDGKWSVKRASSTPYKTRILVYHPTDPARFNGTVVV